MRKHPISSWAQDDYLAAYDGWQSGWGDLPFAVARRPVPAIVQLGVLAHAPWDRLDHLRRGRRFGRAAHTWGRDALALVDRLLAGAPSAAALLRVQRLVLQPLERELLDAGRVDLARVELPALLDPVLVSAQSVRTHQAGVPRDC